jgi:glycolate oxidase FAD binding subunit
LTVAPDIEVCNRDDAVDAVRAAVADGTTLALEGAGTKRGWGAPVHADRIARLAGIAGVLRYEPEELVLTLRPGTPVAEVDALLARHGQMLAFEPPDYAPLWGAAGRATIGGSVACNASGPRRLRAGAARDHLLGAELVNGRAEIVRTGGRVVKNVTGYDLCKLLAGSFGTLGIITEMTFKVLPKPQTSASVAVPVADPRAAAETMAHLMSGAAAPSALAWLPRGLGEPVQLDASAEAIVLARFEGSHAGVSERIDAVRRRLGGTPIDEDGSRPAWARLRDVAPFHGAARCGGSRSPRRRSAISTRSSQATRACAVSRTGEEVSSWVRASGDDTSTRPREWAERAGGRATLFRAPPGWAIPVWPPQQPAVAALNARIRAAFDPAGIFNPGRLG